MSNDLARDYALMRFDYNEMIDRANGFIDALQGAPQGGSVTITNEMRFPVRSRHDDFEAPYREVDSEHGLRTATHWCLHLRLESPEEVKSMAKKILGSGAEYLTGVYVGGDSWAQWAEVYVEGDEIDGHGVALHMYYRAPALPNARIRGGALAKLAYSDRFATFTDLKNGVRFLCAISTAADWAEQAEVIV